MALAHWLQLLCFPLVKGHYMAFGLGGMEWIVLVHRIRVKIPRLRHSVTGFARLFAFVHDRLWYVILYAHKDTFAE